MFMKKIVLLMMLALGAFAAFGKSNDSEIKSLIIQHYKYLKALNFEKAIEFYSSDCKCTDIDGTVETYSMIRNVFLAMDGAHPFEFAVVMAQIENGDKELTSAQKNALRKSNAWTTPDFLQTYQKFVREYQKELKTVAALELKTLQFRSIKVTGSTAVVICEYETMDYSTREIYRETSTMKFRKQQGKWKLSEEVCRKGPFGK